MDAIFVIVAAVLNMGNISFASSEAKNDKSAAKVDGKESETALGKVAASLGWERAELEQCLVKKKTIARKEVFWSPQTAAVAATTRDGLAKFIYAKLFDYLVDRINQSLGESSGRSIGILDIFGFEIFEVNSLEQLCINYTNESLQLQFNNKIFRDEEEEYTRQAIPYTRVNYIDNTPVLDIIENKASGVLAMLDDATNGIGGTDLAFCDALKKRNAEKKDVFPAPAKSNLSGFIVKHVSRRPLHTSPSRAPAFSASPSPNALLLHRCLRPAR
jgi:myosin V